MAVVAADLTHAEQVAFDQAADALRLQDAQERAHEAVSGVRELSPDLPGAPSRSAAPTVAPPDRRLDPPQAGPDAFPQGSIAPQARAGSDPRPVAEVRA